MFSVTLDPLRPRRYPCSMVQQGWLRCESVVRGMFSDELAVVVVRSNGTQESYFVPADQVDQQQNLVRVGLRESNSFFWATLPTPDRATIPVSKLGVRMT
jgi:hypothetical protein